jgi:hypothetical protein
MGEDAWQEHVVDDLDDGVVCNTQDTSGATR